MTSELSPIQEIEVHVARLRVLDDASILNTLRASAPLVDEADPLWEDPRYWSDVAYLYVALGDIAAMRRLRPAIPLLLERACFGDPGEIMRGLRHQLEAIVNPDWDALTEAVLPLAVSSRLGTRLWAIDQLAVLDDPRARPIFEGASSDHKDIAFCARIGLERLDRLKTQ